MARPVKEKTSRTPRSEPSARAEVAPLAAYHAKRDFALTREPGPASSGESTAAASGRASSTSAHTRLEYVVQRHDASHLHYDFRLEHDGVLKSWAVPKGPSLDPDIKRLAVEVEDHPFSYRTFEGTIPAGQYGAGEVEIWDKGYWEPLDEPAQAFSKGHLKFRLYDGRLAGDWILLRTRRGDTRNQWLLRKLEDDHAVPGDDAERSPLSAAHVKKARPARKTAIKAAAPAPGKPRTTRKTASDNDARDIAVPERMEAQLATLVDAVPQGDDWIYEIKYDGYRMLCRIDGDDVRFVSRNGLDWHDRIRPFADAVAKARIGNGWLDGELVVPDAKGITSFSRLQKALGNTAEGADALRFMVFDVPWWEGKDLRSEPLSRRLAVLDGILDARLAKALPQLVRSARLESDGETALAQACRIGLEGLIGKRLDAQYSGRRSPAWVKLKCRPRAEFVIAGYTEPKGSRTSLGALLLGVWEDNALRYVGRVGSGFDTRMLAGLKRRLDRLAAEVCPFETAPPRARGDIVHWVRPELVAEVSFTGWTDDEILRQASFAGLREDKPATDVKREVPMKAAAQAGKPDKAGKAQKTKKTKEAKEAASTGKAAKTAKVAKADTAADDGAPDKTSRIGKGTTPASKAATPGKAAKAPLVRGVKVSHPDRIVFADKDLTKLNIASHYGRVAEAMLPYLQGRPLALLRCPEGTADACFFQKHWPSTGGALPDGLSPVQIPGDPDPYVMVESAQGLVSLAQYGVIELHGWGARQSRLDRPDQITFDLDPDNAVPWSEVVDAALLMRTLLEELGLPAFLRTTGGKGLHVVTPLKPTRSWDEVKGFARGVATHLAGLMPDRFIATMSKARRKGKIFIDYLRNAEGSTAVVPYGVRARPGAPVALPQPWEALSRRKDIRADYFSVASPRRLTPALEAASETWKTFDAARATLKLAVIRKMEDA